MCSAVGAGSALHLAENKLLARRPLAAHGNPRLHAPHRHPHEIIQKALAHTTFFFLFIVLWPSRRSLLRLYCKSCASRVEGFARRVPAARLLLTVQRRVCSGHRASLRRPPVKSFRERDGRGCDPVGWSRRRHVYGPSILEGRAQTALLSRNCERGPNQPLRARWRERRAHCFRLVRGPCSFHVVAKAGRWWHERLIRCRTARRCTLV